MHRLPCILAVLLTVYSPLPSTAQTRTRLRRGRKRRVDSEKYREDAGQPVHLRLDPSRREVGDIPLKQHVGHPWIARGPGAQGVEQLVIPWHHEQLRRG